ncbi:hypothetical protein [Tuberibacillus sp. Marseille-P3662]|uniref:hypothetical protein n=1 Tax=Tuberibacillus sp. Marseille-P3662 TaxID=1965358 RepID=UPI000A1C7E12|nr:hypothetical protein [Tuberibacillus sp. Marseille-P3662]
MKKGKVFKVLSTAALSASFLLGGGLSVSAAEDDSEKIQAITYFVDGEAKQLPQDKWEDFLNRDKPVNVGKQDATNLRPLGKSSTLQLSKTAESPSKDYACYAGYEYAGTKQDDYFESEGNDAKGSVVINQTSDPLTETSQLSTTATVSGKVNASGSYNMGVIEAQVGFEIGATKSWYVSQSTTITVQPGDKGWIEYGTMSEDWAGYYYYLTSNCDQPQKQWISADGPKYKAKLAKTANYY